MENEKEDKIEVNLPLSGVVLGIALIIAIIGTALIYVALT